MEVWKPDYYQATQQFEGTKAAALLKVELIRAKRA